MRKHEEALAEKMREYELQRQQMADNKELEQARIKSMADGVATALNLEKLRITSAQETAIGVAKAMKGKMSKWASEWF